MGCVSRLKKKGTSVFLREKKKFDYIKKWILDLVTTSVGMKTQMNMNTKSLDDDDVPLKTLYPKVKLEVKGKGKVPLKTFHPKTKSKVKVKVKTKSKVEVKVEDKKEVKEEEDIVTHKDIFGEGSDSD